MKKILLLALILAACSPQYHTSLATPTEQYVAFPGCVGFGCNTPAGMGGVVIAVTNLNDSGTGSFRAAVSQSGARIVVFNVSGTIQLSSHIIIDNPYITIAGQTSPNGIQIKGGGIKIRTHDVVIRGLMIRPGNEAAGVKFDDRSGILIQNDKNTTQPYNIVIDHNSLEWGVDENANLWNPQGSHDITFSNNIIAEGLQCAGHPKGCHSMGLAVGYGQKNLTVYANLFASNDWRNPIFQSDVTAEVINNLLYNWIGGGIIMQGTGQGPNFLNVLGNFTMPTTCSYGTGVQIDSYDAGSKLYTDAPIISPVLSSSPAFPLSGLPVMSKGEAYSYVLNNAGARNDAIDQRIKLLTKPNGKCAIDSQSEVGGWAVIPAGTYPDSNRDGLPDGVVDVEGWINSFYTSTLTSTPTKVPTSTPTKTAIPATNTATSTPTFIPATIVTDTPIPSKTATSTPAPIATTCSLIFQDTSYNFLACTH